MLRFRPQKTGYGVHVTLLLSDHETAGMIRVMSCFTIPTVPHSRRAQRESKSCVCTDITVAITSMSPLIW